MDNTANEDAKCINFKIGMVGPTGAGKTSLLTAICEEVQERLVDNKQGRLNFDPIDELTKQVMDRARAAFDTHINNPDNLFTVVQLPPTSDPQEFNYKVTIPPLESGDETLAIEFSIKDYPGRMLSEKGESEFEEEIAPHLHESVALLVPVSADILMYWYNTKAAIDTESKQLHSAANEMLCFDKVQQVIKKWLDIKIKNKQKAQLFFVPVKCEKYFNDNGGLYDKSEVLYSVVNEQYINPLELNDEERKLVQVNVFCIDTYGVVELRNVDNKMEDRKLKLVPIFKRRDKLDKRLMPKNAYELLMSILKFQMENKLIDEIIAKEENEKKKSSSKEEETRTSDTIKKLREEIARRKSELWFWQKILIKLGYPDRRSDDLKAQIQEEEGRLKSLLGDGKIYVGRGMKYDRNIARYENAIKQLTNLMKDIPKRQKQIRTLTEH